MKKIKILIVEDDPMARNLLEIYVNKNSDYELVAAIDNADLAEGYCISSSIDLCLMDVCTAGDESGLMVAGKIKKSRPQTKIIIITSQPEYSYLDKAKEFGVDGFWYKMNEAKTILDVVSRVIAGEMVYPDSTPILQIGEAKSIEFTDRELEVLRELVNGETDADIAANLNMSTRTVKAHIQNMRDKTGFRNRTELAVRARESGLII